VDKIRIDISNTENPLRNFYQRHQKIDFAEKSSIIDEDITNFLKISKVKRGFLNQEEANDLVIKIYQFLYEKLIIELSKYDISVFYHAYKQLELIMAEKIGFYQNYISLSKIASQESLNPDIHKIKIGSNRWEPPIRLLISIILQQGIKGSRVFDGENWSYIFCLCVKLINSSSISDNMYYRTENFTFHIDNTYKLSYNNSNLYDYENYSKSLANKTFNYHKEESELKSEVNNDKTVLEKHQLPSSIEEVNNALLKEYGFSYGNFIMVLVVLGKMMYNKVKVINLDALRESEIFPLFKISKEILIKNLAQLWKAIEESELRNIINFLSIGFNTYNDIAEQIIPSKLHKNYKRLPYFPLISIKDEIIYGNEICLESSRLWVSKIMQGVFPLRIKDNSELKKALNLLHSEKDNLFEDICEEIANNTLGKRYVEKGIDNFHRISKALPKKPECGEIDLLAVNPNTNKIFVLDAKNDAFKYSSSDIKNQDKRYFGENSYYEHLMKKVEFIKDNLNFILEHFSIEESDEITIKKGFIIKETIQHAHKKGTDVDFILKKDLGKYLLE